MDGGHSRRAWHTLPCGARSLKGCAKPSRWQRRSQTLEGSVIDEAHTACRHHQDAGLVAHPVAHDHPPVGRGGFTIRSRATLAIDREFVSLSPDLALDVIGYPRVSRARPFWCHVRPVKRATRRCPSFAVGHLSPNRSTAGTVHHHLPAEQSGRRYSELSRDARTRPIEPRACRRISVSNRLAFSTRAIGQHGHRRSG
jgi:hypothetical protein